MGSQDPAGPNGPGFGAAFLRVDGGEGAETASGGNGLTGHDETSEDVSATWSVQAFTPGQPARRRVEQTAVGVCSLLQRLYHRIRDLGRERYGVMAGDVFHAWGDSPGPPL